MSATPPQLVADRYRLVEPLGQGGMGRVWKARDEVLHRDVAIKELVPPPGLTTEERQEMRERSLREARAIARLNHANVVRIFDVLQTDGDPWIVMEYVPSRSLQDVLANDGPVSAHRAAEIGLGVLGALRAAHRSGVVHRDVKPGNVLLADDGRVVLTDFGLATVPGDPNVTRTGLVLGSPAYIAPERARDGSAGPAADMWSLGATLFAAVEGHSPYARPSAIGTLAALASEPVPTPRHAGPMKAVLNGLLRKEPMARIKADEAERLLRRAAGRRVRGGPSLLDSVRRPGATVRAEAKPTAVLGGAEPVTKLVPEPRPPADPPVPVVPVVPGKEDGDEPTAVAESAPETAKVEMPAPAPEEPESAAPEQPREEPGLLVTVARRPPNRVPFIAAGAVLVVVLALVLISSLGGDDEPGANAQRTVSPTQTVQPTPSRASPSSAATTGAATPSPAPSASGAGFVLPAGWRMHRDSSGFSVAVPEGWTMSREGTMIFFREPGGGERLMGIDQSDSPKSDPVADWTDQEAQRLAANRYRNYQRVKIEAVDYWDKAADWEWTYTSGSGNRLHVLNRGFVTAPDKAYAIYWSTLDSSWQANLSNFALIADSFQPARS